MKYLKSIDESLIMNLKKRENKEADKIVHTIEDILIELNDLRYITEVKYEQIENKDWIYIVIKKNISSTVEHFCITREEYETVIETIERIQRYLFGIDEWRALPLDGPNKMNQLTIRYNLDKTYK